MQGRVALVTGAAGGIGRATALGLVAAGAHVMAADLDADGLAETASMAGSADRLDTRSCDVTDEHAVAALVADTVATFGGLHIAHNNAGINDVATPLHELTIEAWDRMIAVNLTSVFLCMKHEIAHMREHGGGAIVNTASGAAVVPAPGLPHYTAAKRGVAGLTASAAQEYREEGIRVNAVAPGMVDTPMIRSYFNHDTDTLDAVAKFLPQKRMGSAEEIADAVIWLCSDSARWVTGEMLAVDGGTLCRA